MKTRTNQPVVLDGEPLVGDLNIEGNFTANSIIENMEGYSADIVIDETYGSLNIDYAGVCKNGNKITFALAGTINFTSAGVNAGGANILRFNIPSEVGAKLFPTNIGNLSNLLSLNSTFMYGSNNTFNAGRSRIVKNNDTNIVVLLYSTGCSANVDYYFRIEATYLLSENLIQGE